MVETNHTGGVDAPEIRYARSGDTHIAYQVVGDGPVDVLFAMGVPLSVDSLWDATPPARFLRGLTTFARVILFDRRGVGLSDPVAAGSPPTLEQWMADALAVLDELECTDVALLGTEVHGGQVCLLLAATHPTRVSAAIVVNSAATLQRSPEHDVRLGLASPGGTVNRADWLASPETFAMLAPTLASEARLRDWWRRSILRSVSPGVAATMLEVRDATDVRDVLPAIRVPTLVLTRLGCRAYSADYSRYIADHIPSARLVELEGDDQLVFAGDQTDLLAEIELFVTGARPAVEPDRVLATVLVTDIARPTESAAAVGERRWQELLAEHDRIVEDQLARFGGVRVLGTAHGGGALATFDGPARAVRCGRAIVDDSTELGIVGGRCGIHTGEIERRADGIGGFAVRLASSIAARAAAGEVLVSRTVTDLVAGSGLVFEDRGECELDGVPDRWRVAAVAARPDGRAAADARGPTAQSDPLSRRERDVLELIAPGSTTKQIAAALRISEHTVARHVQNMFAKLGVTTRAAAVAAAHDHDRDIR
jgi:pimeloyl-ACP methyl ester carboxylesterase/DNA-binding CsgD family transcriptional regulator